MNAIDIPVLEQEHPSIRTLFPELVFIGPGHVQNTLLDAPNVVEIDFMGHSFEKLRRRYFQELYPMVVKIVAAVKVKKSKEQDNGNEMSSSMGSSGNNNTNPNVFQYSVLISNGRGTTQVISSSANKALLLKNETTPSCVNTNAACIGL